MKWDSGYLLGMALQSIPEPRKVARDLFAEGFSQRALWYMLALILVLSTMLRVVGVALYPPPEGTPPLLSLSPLLIGALGGGFTVLSVVLIDRIGRAMGGTGHFSQALVTMVWLSSLNLLLSATVLGLGLFAPGMALLLVPLGYLALFYIMTMFITELHGFSSPGAVAGMIVVTFIAAIFCLAFVLTLLGFGSDPALIGAVP